MDTRGRRILAIVDIDVFIIQLFPFGATFYKVLTHLTINTGISSLNYMLERKKKKTLYHLCYSIITYFIHLYMHINVRHVSVYTKSYILLLYVELYSI